MTKPLISASVRVIGKEAIEAKLARAEANILIHNRAMVSEMLGFVKAEVIPQIPIGPGHFGYHLRDTFIIDVKGGLGQAGTKVTGVLKSAVQGYWREFGTGARHRRGHTKHRQRLASVVFGSGGLGSGGEPAYMTANHALAEVRKFITFYYGGLAKWWHL